MICWINPSTGLAGDMLLGALIDAGAPLERIRAAITATGLTGWELSAHQVVEHGLAATRVEVDVSDHVTERHASELIALASRAIPEPVAARAVTALTAIAEAEAQLHGADPASVHLHELGGHDTVVDIVGTLAALHALGVEEVVCAPLPLGTGTITTAHGVLPCPAPATLTLLRQAAVVGTDLPGETVTPTAAALLRATDARYGPIPLLTLGRTGYGAGTRTLPDRPNVVGVTLGDRQSVTEPVTEPVTILETNLDDVTGETLGYVITRAVQAGALDAWATPAVMKKSRPANVLHVLTRPADADRLLSLILAETGTLGVRLTTTNRVAAPRRMDTVEIDGVAIRVKHGVHGAKAEHDDLVTAADRLNLPLRAVTERVVLAINRRKGTAP